MAPVEPTLGGFADVPPVIEVRYARGLMRRLQRKA
jgi:hypothetical protein